MRYAEPEEAAEEIPLLGGDVTEGVVRVGATVRRPVGPNGAAIHAVLDHLERAGFDGAPRYLGIDRASREVLSFIDGEVAGRPRPSWIAAEDRLRSVARLLRRYDDAVADFSMPVGVEPDWGIPSIDLPPLPSEPVMILGHQDVTPENVVFSPAGEAIALIDFDLMKPCSPLAEVINGLIWWAPLADPLDRDPLLRDVDVPRRCRIFADTYGLADRDRAGLVESALTHTRRSWRLMRHRAETQGGGWARMWEEGIGEVINRRYVWLNANADLITTALLVDAPPVGRS